MANVRRKRLTSRDKQRWQKRFDIYSLVVPLGVWVAFLAAFLLMEAAMPYVIFTPLTFAAVSVAILEGWKSNWMARVDRGY